ncbi:HD domain-containing protein [Kamptonema sp. UHCC 0994]|uniref:HD domain-containing protein n=1 Tax=Kamptonema sp. UHCC 0994 TaxID=3031329 RepID=UPI0023BB0224|nr:HD domain-containing protein [Kamptonema sp. UHCC 0994]MDF0556431.1 HD domain-containing protein [Kamptonema sp. UHCC 0994]
MKSPILTDKFELALVYATRLHAKQFRKVDGTPYIAHLLSVAALVLEARGNETEAIAGLLHDSLEDQGGPQTQAEIRQQFGAEVLEIIKGCTESEALPKPPWMERKQRYLYQLEIASPSVRLVSLADKLHNAKSLLASLHQYGEEVWTYFKVGKESSLWFYQALLPIYRTTNHNWMVQEFEQVLQQITGRYT